MKILGKNFVETTEMFNKGEITCDIYQDIVRAMSCAATQDDLEAGAINTETILSWDESKDDYNGLFGGDFCLVETVEDLKEVSTAVEAKVAGVTEKRLNGWASIIDVATSFDICEYLPNGDHIIAMMCWNDAGGTVFYIPSKFADEFPTIKGCIEATSKYWSTGILPEENQ
jgi:hypothetical protein